MGKDRHSQHAPDKAILTASILACTANGERLLDGAMQVEFQEPPATKLMLSMIAQEEFAKAFLLFLVRENIVPWTPQLWRAMRDHACKHLVGVMIEYADFQWETIEEAERLLAEEFERRDHLPPKVASALNILRHEKIGRWESKGWMWVEPPEYDPSVLGIANGQRDRLKQEALYVGLGRNAEVTSIPTEVTEASASAEYAIARRYRSFVASLMEHGEQQSLSYEKTRDALRAIFSDRG
jgi:AbiV family abortive infection protein